jgi:hypothetical protein
VDRTALQRDQRDQPLTRGWQLYKLVIAVNGESAQQVQRQLF